MSEAVNAEVDGPGKLQKYGAFNLKKKVYPEGLEKGTIDVKEILKSEPFISNGPL